MAAEITGVAGVLDLTARRLVPDPQAAWRALAGNPDLLTG